MVAFCQKHFQNSAVTAKVPFTVPDIQMITFATTHCYVKLNISHKGNNKKHVYIDGALVNFLTRHIYHAVICRPM